MEIKFCIDDKAITKICKAEVELAAAAVARKTINNKRLLETALTEAASATIKEKLEEINETELWNLIEIAIEDWVANILANLLVQHLNSKT